MSLSVKTFRSFLEIANKDFGNEFVKTQFNALASDPNCTSFVAHLRNKPDLEWPSGTFRLLYAFLNKEYQKNLSSMEIEEKDDSDDSIERAVKRARIT